MKPAIIGLGGAIAILSASTTALAQSIDFVEISPSPQIYTVPTPIRPPVTSIIRYPVISYPYSQRYSIPVAPTSPLAPIVPLPPAPPTYGAPFSNSQTITLPSVEIYPRRRSYRQRAYSYPRSRTIYINPRRSQVKTTILYSNPTYLYNPYNPFRR